MSRGEEVSGGPRPDAEAPLPTNSQPFEFTCSCLNVRVEGRAPLERLVPSKHDSGSSSRYQIWIGEEGETSKLASYVAWDQDDLKQERRNSTGVSSKPSSDTLSPCWRKCWACGTPLYLAAGKERFDAPVASEWVTIDLASGIRWGKDLIDDENDRLDRLPFSELRIALTSSTSSNFGRPPQTNFPAIYAPVSSNAEASQYLIPPVPDPFFLPPPFIPSHPHLRDLCDKAVVHLRRKHDELEHEVREYIHSKSREMMNAQEKVRKEVELLWGKYQAGPGAAEDPERRKSLDAPTPQTLGQERRDSRTGRSSSFKSATPLSAQSHGQTPSNPILMEAARNPAYPAGASLLSASLSANPYAATPPAPVADAVDDSLASVSKTYSKGSDARAVAMSHVFSVLDEAMASRGPSKVGMSMEDRYVETEYDEAQNEEAEGKDSWIDEESGRSLRAKGREMLDIPDVSTQGSTPRMPSKAQTSVDDKSTPKGKGKEKAVKFEDPKVEQLIRDDEVFEIEEEEEAAERDADDYVFDFDMDDSAPQDDPDDLVSATPPQPPRTFSRTRNMVEANLSRTFAADAPSHRSAWKRHLERGTSMFDSIRRPTEYSANDDDMSDNSISQLATSMPVAIALNPSRRRQGELPPRERKTSLTDREGILVPPLRVAMREMGISKTNALGLSPSNPGRSSRSPQRAKGSIVRSASVSREREQATSFKLDPGAVFESLADDADEDDEADGEDEGTLRDSKFIPPHELIRKEEGKQGPEVGWRSLAS
ncbi:hypothetical protein BD324DRAFT_649953 [Kockovaella imperatae]|uniref:Uncharacterized protein n=1 Tax=Kockovaella imperatae TaxID=4999 RepID=A0A1Y1UN91_9TREE|nr:hypothetical protein BD324DRAFT_649953 [Kockovaella imperatae]ORX38595.1 hypothetical protein BD324DRAFT_649953 [Kockovaella imperatae]